MKKQIITICLAFLVMPVLAQKKVEIAPKKSIGKVVLAGKKDYVYYALSDKSRTEYQVTGPGQLFLNFRVRIEEEDAFKSQPFRVKYIRNGNNVKTVDIPELMTSNLKFKSKSLAGHPSRPYKLVINVPPGKQTYRFYKQKTDQKSHMRAFYAAHPKPVWEDIKPTLKLDKKELRFVKSGVVRSYYEITKKAGFDFTVSDTSRIRVIVRPVFTYKMLEETILKIKLQNLTSGESKIYKINSDKSDKVEFVSDEKLIPGTSKTFYLNLPKPSGKADAYSVTLVSGSKAAIIRLSNDKKLIR